MPSKRKLAPVVSRDGINSGYSREQEVATVELDTTFGRLLGLAEGQKVCQAAFTILRIMLTRDFYSYRSAC